MFADRVDALHIIKIVSFSLPVSVFLPVHVWNGSDTATHIQTMGSLSQPSIHLLTSFPIHATSRRRRSVTLTVPLVSEFRFHSHHHHRHSTRNFTPTTFRSVNRSNGSDVPAISNASPLSHSHHHHRPCTRDFMPTKFLSINRSCGYNVPATSTL